MTILTMGLLGIPTLPVQLVHLRRLLEEVDGTSLLLAVNHGFEWVDLNHFDQRVEFFVQVGKPTRHPKVRVVVPGREIIVSVFLSQSLDMTPGFIQRLRIQ